MPFNKETDTNITISKKHKEMLRTIAVEQKRTLRGTLEMLIENIDKGILLINAPVTPSNADLVKARDMIKANKPGAAFEDNNKRLYDKLTDNV